MVERPRASPHTPGLNGGHPLVAPRLPNLSWMMTSPTTIVGVSIIAAALMIDEVETTGLHLERIVVTQTPHLTRKIGHSALVIQTPGALDRGQAREGGPINMTTLTEARLMALAETTPQKVLSPGMVLFKVSGPVVCMLAPTITAESLQAGPTA